MESKSKLSVLTVDDEPDIAFLTKIILQKEGYTVANASSGKDCIEKIKEDKPDIILMDVGLPDIDGWEVCKKIKKNAKTSSIPIVMFTARSSKEDISKSFEYAGAVGHLPRPFETETLTDILKCINHDPSEIMNNIDKVVEKEKRRSEVLKMFNPKIINYKYDF